MTPFAGLLRSEWTKLISLRSTKVALALSVVAALALTALLAVVAGATRDQWTPQDVASWEPAETSLIGGLLAAIVYTVLGVTAATSEYASRTIQLTFTATPRRARVITAKTLVLATVTLAAGLVSNVAMFLVGQLLFGSYGLDTASPLDSEALHPVFIGAALTPVLPVVALLIGIALRSTAAALTAVFGLAFGVPVLGELLPRWWQDHVFDFMLFAAANAITHPSAPGTPAKSVAALTLATWLAMLFAATCALVTRRDT